ncbi:MAG: MFS transporter [Bacteroidota bacterium]
MQSSKSSLIAVRYPALASRDYVLFVTGQLISVIGTWMQATALPYLAYRMTGRPLDLGLIGFASTLPTLLFALPAGVLVERWDKRRTVIIFQAIMSLQAFALAYLSYTGKIQMWQIIFLAFFYGSAVAVEVTARQSMLIELTGRESLQSAIALQTTAFNVGRVIGPVCAAWIMAVTGSASAVFLANGISFLFVIAGLFLARTPYKVDHENGLQRDLAGEFKEGLTYIKNNALVLSIVLMAALVGFFGIPLTQQIPALARSVLRPLLETETLIATRTSSLYAAQGVGALVAAFMAASMPNSNKQKWLLLGQVAFIFPIIALGLITRVNAALLLLVLIGWGTVTQLVMMNTIVQTDVPDTLRGRVFSVYFWALQGVAPFGSIVIGWIAQNWSVPSAAVFSGTICLVGIVTIRLAIGRRQQIVGLTSDKRPGT